MTVHETPVGADADLPHTLTVTAELRPPDLDVRLSGEIDLACAGLLDAVTQVELDGVTRVNVDLSELEFSDLAGLRALLAFRSRHARADRVVVLTQAQPAVRRVFELAGHGDELAPAA